MPKRYQDRYEELLPDRLPIDVLPYSNGEYVPPDPTPEQAAIMRIAMDECDRAAKRLGMSRRRFLQTSAAYAVCLSVINRVMGGNYAVADECGLHTGPISQRGGQADIPLEFPGAQLNNLPGEFIMDLQTHHVISGGDGGEWRVRNPGQEAFFAAVFGGSQCKSIELDPIECIGRFHYLKELFLDSSTNLTVLSAVPYSPDGQPLPIDEAANTAGIVNALAGGTRRCVIHKFVMPNRGSLGTASDRVLGPSGVDPVFLQEEFDDMESAASKYGNGGPLRAWKVYTPWGDVPYSSGWWLDDPVGRKFIEHALYLSARYRMPALICAHKGFALPTFEQTKAATRDVGIVAKEYPAMNFIIYHSGYDGDSISLGGPLNQGTSASGEYPGPQAAPSINRGVDNFITALVENGRSARHVALGKLNQNGLEGAPDPAGGMTGEYMEGGHANNPNVYAELGSVWSSVASNPLRAAYLMTKLIWYVGPKRIVWGTDCLWSGSPQPQIVTFRAFNMRRDFLEAEIAAELAKPNPDPNRVQTLQKILALAIKYRLPYGLDGHVDDPETDAKDTPFSIRNAIFGRTAAALYGITEGEIAAATDPSAFIDCAEVQKIRDRYLVNPYTPNPLARMRESYRSNPMASHRIWGPRTRRELFASLREDPWHRGARRMQNESARARRKSIG